MKRPDWILLRTSNPKSLEPVLELFSEICTHSQPTRRVARVLEREEGVYVIHFDGPLAAAQFTNLIGCLVDSAEVSGATGWLEGAKGKRYQVRPVARPANEQDTRFLVAVCESGVQYEIDLAENKVCEVGSTGERFEEPNLDLSGTALFEWALTLDGDRYPLLAVTHPPRLD